MKKVFALLGACAALGAFCAPASVQAAPAVAVAVEEHIIWGGTTTEHIIWGEINLPAGTMMGYSVASANSVYVWAWVPGASGPILLGEQAIWGV